MISSLTAFWAASGIGNGFEHVGVSEVVIARCFTPGMHPRSGFLALAVVIRSLA